MMIMMMMAVLVLLLLVMVMAREKKSQYNFACLDGLLTSVDLLSSINADDSFNLPPWINSMYNHAYTHTHGGMNYEVE